MIEKDFVRNTLRPQRDNLVLESNKEWLTYKTELTDEVDKFQDEQEGIEKDLEEKENLDINQRNVLKKRKSWIGNFVSNLLRQSEKRSD